MISMLEKSGIFSIGMNAKFRGNQREPYAARLDNDMR